MSNTQGLTLSMWIGVIVLLAILYVILAVAYLVLEPAGLQAVVASVKRLLRSLLIFS
jgi:PDZ domain-containing secreted protein